MQTIAQRRLLQSHVARHMLHEQHTINKPVKQAGQASFVYKFVRSFILIAILTREIN